MVWYKRDGTTQNIKQWLRATYKLRNKSSTAIIQQYQLVKTSLSLVSLLTTSWTSINRSPMWQERYPNSLQYWKCLRNILPRYKEKNLIISYCPPPPPHFDNFFDVWYFCSKTASDKLEKVNEGALHFVLKDKSSPYTELLLRRSTTYNLRGTDFLNSPKVNSTKTIWDLGDTWPRRYGMHCRKH